MKYLIVLCTYFLPFFAWSQKDSVQSGVYNHESLARQSTVSSTTLFEGKVQDMAWLQMSANVLRLSQQQNVVVPMNEERLMIVKSGKLRLVVKDTTYTISAGSIALIMPGDHFSMRREGIESCEFYLMKYRSKLPTDMSRGRRAGGSIVKDINSTVFTPHDKGGRRDFFERPTAMCRRMEIHMSTLNPGLKSHEPHTHAAEEMVVVTEGNTVMQIRDSFYNGHDGSVYYLGSNVSHAIQNSGKKQCTYFAIQFE